MYLSEVIENVIEKNIVDTLTDNYMPYSAYVILERALPEIDGFKPSQRRILYTMYKMGLLNGARKKSQSIVGQTMFLHPHGDMSIYETLVRMTKDAESLLIPYINSKGNFGKHYSRDMKYASGRYTEAKLEKISEELFKDIDKNIVDMVDNYDGTLKEPRLLPVTFPSILTNPQSGIANGMSSSIASFNLSEVIDFTIAYIKDKNTEVFDYIKAPDFPTGGSIIYNETALRNVLNKGVGTVNIRANYEIEGDSIIFKEIPYTTTFEAVIDKIRELVKDGKIKEIIDIDDIMGINSVGIDITVKKNIDKEILIEKLYAMTPLQSVYSCNFNIVVGGTPKVLGVKEIIHEWLIFRENAIKRSKEYDKNKKLEKRHLLLAFKKVLMDIDKAIKIIRETKKNSDVLKSLMTYFEIDIKQAEFVSNIKLKYLNEEYLLNKINEIDTLEKEINELESILENKKELDDLIINQLKEIKEKYGQDRKTKIINVEELTKEEIEEIKVEDYNVRLFITKDGYIKKIPLTSLRGNFEIKVKDGDSIIREIETTNNSELLVFTDKRNVYKYKVYDLIDSKPSLLGSFMPNVLGLEDENILFTTSTKDYSGYLIVGFVDGKVAKINVKTYETKQNRQMLKNAYANKKAIFFEHIHENIDILAVSSINKALIFSTSLINPKNSRTVIGNQIMKSKNGSEVLLYSKLENDEINDYYRVSSAGVGKFLKDNDFNYITKNTH